MVFLGSLVLLLLAPPLTTDSDDMEAALTKIQNTKLLQGKVCPDPARPCPGFRENEISFRVAKKFEFDRGEDRSLPFYAVIVASGPLCGLSEEKRLSVQALYPSRKVFLHRYFCEDFSDDVTYTNVDQKVGFIAAYAGEKAAEAKTFLAEVTRGGKFPDAYLKKMQVVIRYQLE
jgi:hypothetical protein